MGDECFVVGLVGVGIDTSATPSLHEAEADAIGIRYAYQLIDLDEIDVEPENIIELLRAARRMGFRGLNITHPCKRHVVPYVDELSPEAEATGAVNTVVFGAAARAARVLCAVDPVRQAWDRALRSRGWAS